MIEREMIVSCARADLVTKLPVVLGGLGLAALGAKVDDAAGKPGAGQSAREK